MIPYEVYDALDVISSHEPWEHAQCWSEFLTKKACCGAPNSAWHRLIHSMSGSGSYSASLVARRAGYAPSDRYT